MKYGITRDHTLIKKSFFFFFGQYHDLIYKAETETQT